MKTVLKIVAALVALIVVGVGIFVATFDVDKYKPDIIQAVKNATGRDLTIQGKLSLSLFPRLAVTVNNVALANAPWGSRKEMIQIGQFSVAVQAIPLIAERQLLIDRLGLSDVDILLETDKAGNGNWTLSRPQPAAATSATTDAKSGGSSVIPQLDTLDWQRVKLTYKDGATGTARTFDIASLLIKRKGDLIDVTLDSKLNDAPVKLTGTMGRLETIAMGGTAPFPVNVKIAAADASLAVDGKVANPTTDPVLDLAIAVTGQNLNALSPLAGTTLPKSKPYKLAAKVTGSPKKELKLAGLDAALGATTVTGDLTVGMGGPRPKLVGKLSSPLIDLDELESAVGDGKAAAAKPAAKPPAANGRVIPDTPLPLDGLNAADVDLTLAVAKLKAAPLELATLNTRAQINDGLLTVRPFTATFRQTPLNLDVSANAKAAQIAVRGDAKGLPLGELLKEFAGVDKLKDAPTDVSFDLSGVGRTVRSLAAALNGQTTVVVHKGTIAGSYGELIGDGPATILRLQESRGVQTGLKCVVSRFDVKSGIATARVLTIDTARLTVTGQGDINLGTEHLNLRMTPHQISIPVDVGGTFANPTFTPDAKAIATTAAGAAAGVAANAATGGVAGAAGAVLGALQGGRTASSTPAPAGGDPCETAMAQLSGKAPPAPAAASQPAKPASPAPAQQPTTPTNPVNRLLQGLGGALKQ